MDERTGLPIVGLIGGGPSARLVYQAAIALGQSLRVLAESADDVAAAVVPDVCIGRSDDLEALRKFVRGCDVVTFAHAPVPVEALNILVADGVNIPGVEAWRSGSDRFGRTVEQRPRRPLAPVVESSATSRTLMILTARSPFGQVATYPPAAVRSAARLSRAAVPAEDAIAATDERATVMTPVPGLELELAVEAQRRAIDLAVRLDVVGLLTVVFSETAEGLHLDDLVLGPSPLGRWTLDGARTSQYEQLLRAVLDYPLGDTRPVAPVVATASVAATAPVGAAASVGAAAPVAATVLGVGKVQVPGLRPGGMRLDERLHHMFAADPGARVHLYGRQEQYVGGEAGHVTVLADDVDDARSRLDRAVRWLQEGSDD